MQNQIEIFLHLNSQPNQRKKVRIDQLVSLEQLHKICSNIFSINSKILYCKNGQQIEKIYSLQNEDTIYVSEGEQFNEVLMKKYEKMNQPSFKKISKLKDVFNLAIMGSAEVGKSSIVLRYLYDIFSPDYLKTLEDIYMKEDNIEYKPCRIRLLDTSGLDVYLSLRSLWMKEQDALVFVFSLDNLQSFKEIQNFYKCLNVTHYNKGVPLILVGNKKDLDRQVSYKQAYDYAQEIQAIYIETSAKLGQSIESIFINIVQMIRGIKKLFYCKLI